MIMKENYEKVYIVLTYMYLIYCQLTNYNGTSRDICPSYILGLRKYLSKRSSQLRYVTKKKRKRKKYIPLFDLFLVKVCF